MKVLKLLIGPVILALSHSALAEVEVKTAPLAWKEARSPNGEELFVELCAACHGKGGQADGPVTAALKNTVPDLTLLAENNDGTFPQQQVKDAIIGKSRVVSHGTVDMPVWGAAFEDVRLDWKPARRKAFARQRIDSLVEYISTIQTK